MLTLLRICILPIMRSRIVHRGQWTIEKKQCCQRSIGKYIHSYKSAHPSEQEEIDPWCNRVRIVLVAVALKLGERSNSERHGNCAIIRIE